MSEKSDSAKRDSAKSGNQKGGSGEGAAASKESFEQRLQRLEELSEQIRQGDVSLDEAVKQFEEGIRLAKGLEKELSTVERKVEILINEPEEDSDEKPALELFPELSDLNAGSGSEESDSS